MKLFTFLVIFCSIQFVISSQNIWKCNLNVYLELNCACSVDCSEMIYNTNTFDCGSVISRYDQINDITFKNCNLSSINTFQIEKFLSLKEIFLRNISDQQIDRDLFNIDSDVDQLFANDNNITNIRKNAFKHMKKLIGLHLHRNLIETIEDDTFADLSELWLLALSYNKLTSINERAFVGLNNLWQLYLRHNNITTIHKNAFSDLINLRVLRLNSNSIKHIETGTFANLKKLKWLDLTKNALQTFDFELILPLRETLELIFIADNKIIELEIPTDANFPSLYSMQITGNQFNCCKMQRFFNLTEGKALANKVDDSFAGVYCDGDRKVDSNGHILDLICNDQNFTNSTKNDTK